MTLSWSLLDTSRAQGTRDPSPTSAVIDGEWEKVLQLVGPKRLQEHLEHQRAFLESQYAEKNADQDQPIRFMRQADIEASEKSREEMQREHWKRMGRIISDKTYRTWQVSSR